jgi:hypothetical protein
VLLCVHIVGEYICIWLTCVCIVEKKKREKKEKKIKEKNIYIYVNIPNKGCFIRKENNFSSTATLPNCFKMLTNI